METCLVYDPALAAYRLAADHPLRPERFVSAVGLMEAYGLLSPPAPRGVGTIDLVPPAGPATDAELQLVHDAGYVAIVHDASTDPRAALPRSGIGTPDTPAFAGMHDAAAAVVGATLTAMRKVVEGRYRRALSVAGGLHHAHRGRAAGFCVYNDCAVAIADTRRRRPDLRILYLDIDAHHGDGVQEAFYDDPGVVTLSIHETGRVLYPGTGYPADTGAGAGVGFALNVPLPEGAGQECYAMVFDRVVEPLARRFAPDIVFAQCGADTHCDDPLTTLGLTVRGYRDICRRITSLADEVCDGRIVACGGGGYGWEHVVPRCWTVLAAVLAGRSLSETLPESWRAQAGIASGATPPAGLFDERSERVAPDPAALSETALACEEVLRWTRI